MNLFPKLVSFPARPSGSRVLRLALLLLLSLIPALALTQGDAHAQSQPVPAKKVEPKRGKPGAENSEPQDNSTAPPPERILLPFEEKASVTYVWIYDGTRVGTTQVRYEWFESEGEPRLKLDGAWQYSREGRGLAQRGQTVLDARLRPISFEASRQGAAAPGFVGASTWRTEVKEGKTHLRFERATHEPIELQLPLPEPSYFYDGQSFEHWVIVALLLHHGAPRTLNFVMPHEMKLLEGMKFVRQRQEGDLVRWRAEHPEMLGTFWVSAKGQIMRYKQKKLMIVHESLAPEFTKGNRKK